MKRCTRCILPETFPGIKFDEKGVCNHCRKPYRQSKKENRKKWEDKFLLLIEEYRKKTWAGSTYDVIMAYSGGKDSTYTLDIFVNRYNLRVLAYTFDNAFMSPGAFVNIRNVCANLGVDSLVVHPSPKMLKKIFRVASIKPMYSPKTLERASTICTSCIGMVKSSMLRTALEKNIPFVGFGWSPGQAPLQSSVMKTNAALMKASQKAIYDPLHEIAGDAINPLFVTDEQFSQPECFPWNIHPLAFLNYDEDKIVERNMEIGWEKPDDTDHNSTNCLLNAFANNVHRKRYGFHPYVWEIANMVRQGVMTREEGLAKIEPPENPDMVSLIEKQLGE